jgi:hypothetical protein
LPCPSPAIANDVQAPATKSASASALSFTVRFPFAVSISQSAVETPGERKSGASPARITPPGEEKAPKWPEAR